MDEVMNTLEMFTAALDGEWRVVRYSVDEPTGRLRIHYLSMVDLSTEWTHTPFGELVNMPKIGTIGRIGFISNK